MSVSPVVNQEPELPPVEFEGDSFDPTKLRGALKEAVPACAQASATASG